MHLDMAAIRAGARADGGVFLGAPMTAGFERIAEPAEIMSVMLLLEDGQVAFGDCADVIFAGAAGRDAIFRPSEHLSLVRTHLAAALAGRDVSLFRQSAEELDAWTHGGRRLHTAVRYGVTQALLHAASLARATTMAEVVASDYDCRLSSKPIALLANCHNNDLMQLDRMILKRVELLPHAYFTSVENELGHGGEKLVAWLAGIARRVREVGDADYKPRLHIDVYGTVGEPVRRPGRRHSGLSRRVFKLRRIPMGLLVESPLIAATRAEQIEKFSALRQALSRKRIAVPVIVDEWCKHARGHRGIHGEAGAAGLRAGENPRPRRPQQHDRSSAFIAGASKWVSALEALPTKLISRPESALTSGLRRSPISC